MEACPAKITVETEDELWKLVELHALLAHDEDAGEIKPFLSALKTLEAEPESEPNFRRLVPAFDDLGPRQGAVLTCAPYVNTLQSDDPFHSV